MLTPLQLSTIHKLFRGRQNIVVSSLLREHGYQYRVAFGCSLPDVKQLAQQILQQLADPASPLAGLTAVEVAEALWADEGIRESKLAAPLLYPRGTMTVEVAERWADHLPTPEVADVACMYAFQFGIGQQLIQRWQDSPDRMRRYCALNLIKRLS